VVEEINWSNVITGLGWVCMGVWILIVLYFLKDKRENSKVFKE
jgi:hypothetical protein